MEKPHAIHQGEGIITAAWALVVSSPVTGVFDWLGEGRCNACQAAAGLELPIADVSGACADADVYIWERSASQPLSVYAWRRYYALCQAKIKNFSQAPKMAFLHPNILAHFLSLCLLPN